MPSRVEISKSDRLIPDTGDSATNWLSSGEMSKSPVTRLSVTPLHVGEEKAVSPEDAKTSIWAVAMDFLRKNLSPEGATFR